MLTITSIMIPKMVSAASFRPTAIKDGSSFDSSLTEIEKALKKAIRPILVRYSVGSPARLLKLTELVVASLVAETPASSRTPEIEALMRGIAAREHFKTMEGGHVSADDAGAILGISKVSVLDRHRKGHLLGWRAAQDAVRLPVWQFSEEGVLQGLNEVLRVWKGMPHLDDWAKVIFFLSPLDSVKNTSPLKLMRKGQIRRVVDFARAYAE